MTAFAATSFHASLIFRFSLLRFEGHMRHLSGRVPSIGVALSRVSGFICFRSELNNRVHTSRAGKWGLDSCRRAYTQRRLLLFTLGPAGKQNQPMTLLETGLAQRWHLPQRKPR